MTPVRQPNGAPRTRSAVSAPGAGASRPAGARGPAAPHHVLRPGAAPAPAREVRA